MKKTLIAGVSALALTATLLTANTFAKDNKDYYRLYNLMRKSRDAQTERIAYLEDQLERKNVQIQQLNVTLEYNYTDAEKAISYWKGQVAEKESEIEMLRAELDK